MTERAWLGCAGTLQGAKRTFPHVLSSAVSSSQPEELCSAFLCRCETLGAGSRFLCRGGCAAKFLDPPLPEMCPPSMGFGACGTGERVSCSSAVPRYHSAGVSCRNGRCPTAAGDRRSDLLCSQSNSGAQRSHRIPVLGDTLCSMEQGPERSDPNWIYSEQDYRSPDCLCQPRLFFNSVISFLPV